MSKLEQLEKQIENLYNKRVKIILTRLLENCALNDLRVFVLGSLEYSDSSNTDHEILL